MRADDSPIAATVSLPDAVAPSGTLQNFSVSSAFFLPRSAAPIRHQLRCLLHESAGQGGASWRIAPAGNGSRRCIVNAPRQGFLSYVWTLSSAGPYVLGPCRAPGPAASEREGCPTTSRAAGAGLGSETETVPEGDSPRAPTRVTVAPEPAQGHHRCAHRPFGEGCPGRVVTHGECCMPIAIHQGARVLPAPPPPAAVSARRRPPRIPGERARRPLGLGVHAADRGGEAL